MKRKTDKRRGGRAGKAIVALAIALGIAGSTELVAAQDGWDVSLGLGFFSEAVYPGSEDSYSIAFPTLKATYRTGTLSCSASLLEGVDLTYVHAGTGLVAGLSANQGSERNRENYSMLGVDSKHSARTAQLLAGSANLSNPVYGRATLGYLSPIGLIGASVGYYPTRVTDDPEGGREVTRHGLLYSVQYMASLPLSGRLSLSGLLGLELMDQVYADAWFSRAGSNPAARAFRARAGLKEAQAVAQLEYAFSGRIGVNCLWANMFLLGDAGGSPYTTDSSQHTISLQTVYRF